MGAPQPLPDAPAGRLHCLSYTPFEPGDRNARHPSAVSPARIDQDLRALRAYTDCLRLYTPLGNTPLVMEVASREGFQILLGAWIGSDLDQNEKEIDAALALTARYPQTIRTLVVGNEVLLRREMSADRLAALIREVRERSAVPVAYADVAHFIAFNPQVADAAELLMIHLLPYWDDPAPPPARQAVGQVLTQYREFHQQFPHKELMLGETGWPSAGRARGPGRASRLEQARFIREFARAAQPVGIRYNLIEAIDQPWKRAAEGTVGGYWGLLDEYRRPKFSLQGPVSEWPDWPRQAAISTAVCALSLLAGLYARLGVRGWAGWSAVSLIGALAVVLQWHDAQLVSRSTWDWLLAAGAALLTMVAAGHLLDLLATGQRPPPSPLIGLVRRPSMLFTSRAGRQAAFIAATLLPLAWVSLTLAFAPRHRDIPVMQLLMPVLALVFSCYANAGADRREEATLAAIILGCGLLQVEPANGASVGWFFLAALASLPWLDSLGAELARVGRFFAHARQAQ